MAKLSDEKIINLIQERLAYSTMNIRVFRNQGRGKVEKAWRFMKSLNLKLLTKESERGVEKEYSSYCNRTLHRLQKKFHKQNSNTFGIATKALNIFLIECYLNKELNKEYKLERIKKFLEVPIDSKVAKFLKKKYKFLPTFKSIKCLNNATYFAYQERAKFHAQNFFPKEYAFGFYIDLVAWRKK